MQRKPTYLTNTMSTYPAVALISAVFCTHCYPLHHYYRTSIPNQECAILSLFISLSCSANGQSPITLFSTCDTTFWVIHHPRYDKIK